MKYLKLFKTHTKYETHSSEEMILPNVSKCILEDEIHYNPWTWAGEYLTFVAKENGTFTFTPQNSNVISYSTDGGKTWIVGNSVSVSNGDKVLWKGTMTPSSLDGIGQFSSTAEFDIQGNIMSLLYGSNYKGQTDLTGKNGVFWCLFDGNTKVINTENLSLPAPTLAEYCYFGMFYGCTSLTTAPKLPATTLANDCYSGMFYACTSLVKAPELPATTLANSCYEAMFTGCTSLTTAPELPATTLVSNCYKSMFTDCTNLNYIKAMFTTTPSGSYTSNWVSGVAASGTFIKNSTAQWNVTGVYAIPSGWTVQTASV